jgi:hypothetical protein
LKENEAKNKYSLELQFNDAIINDYRGMPN